MTVQLVIRWIKKTIGPSYTMVAQKYDFNIETVNTLSEKIINGGTGVWGQQPMSAHPNLSEPHAKAMAAYILSTVPDDDSQIKPGVAVDFLSNRRTFTKPSRSNGRAESECVGGISIH